jgi:hypothetical protein
VYQEIVFDLDLLLKAFKQNLEKESNITTPANIDLTEFTTFIGSLQGSNEKAYFMKTKKKAEKENVNNDLDKKARDFYQEIVNWN